MRSLFAPFFLPLLLLAPAAAPSAARAPSPPAAAPDAFSDGFSDASEGTAFEDGRWADPDARRAALSLARRAFDAYARRREVLDPPRTLPRVFQGPAAVFVSAMRPDGSPRCCMGSLYPTQPDAAEEIIASADAAAGHDRRFPPLRPSELSRLTLIVSVVARPRPITGQEAGRLDPTREGLAAQNGDRWGVVLSGETARPENLPRWARVRAGAAPDAPVRWFAVRDVRMKESRP